MRLMYLLTSAVALVGLTALAPATPREARHRRSPHPDRLDPHPRPVPPQPTGAQRDELDVFQELAEFSRHASHYEFTYEAGNTAPFQARHRVETAVVFAAGSPDLLSDVLESFTPAALNRRPVLASRDYQQHRHEQLKREAAMREAAMREAARNERAARAEAAEPTGPVMADAR